MLINHPCHNNNEETILMMKYWCSLFEIKYSNSDYPTHKTKINEVFNYKKYLFFKPSVFFHVSEATAESLWQPLGSKPLVIAKLLIVN